MNSEINQEELIKSTKIKLSNFIRWINNEGKSKLTESQKINIKQLRNGWLNTNLYSDKEHFNTFIQFHWLLHVDFGNNVLWQDYFSTAEQVLMFF